MTTARLQRLRRRQRLRHLLGNSKLCCRLVIQENKSVSYWRETTMMHPFHRLMLHRKRAGFGSLCIVLTVRRYVSALYAVVVCPSVCPPVCPSQAGIVWKRLDG